LTYIDADIRYLDLDYFINEFGYFDIIVMDPFWEDPQLISQL